MMATGEMRETPRTLISQFIQNHPSSKTCRRTGLRNRIRSTSLGAGPSADEQTSGETKRTGRRTAASSQLSTSEFTPHAAIDQFLQDAKTTQPTRRKRAASAQTPAFDQTYNKSMTSTARGNTAVSRLRSTAIEVHKPTPRSMILAYLHQAVEETPVAVTHDAISYLDVTASSSESAPKRSRKSIREESFLENLTLEPEVDEPERKQGRRKRVRPPVPAFKSHEYLQKGSGGRLVVKVDVHRPMDSPAGSDDEEAAEATTVTSAGSLNVSPDGNKENDKHTSSVNKLSQQSQRVSGPDTLSMSQRSSLSSRTPKTQDGTLSPSHSMTLRSPSRSPAGSESSTSNEVSVSPKRRPLSRRQTSQSPRQMPLSPKEILLRSEMCPSSKPRVVTLSPRQSMTLRSPPRSPTASVSRRSSTSRKVSVSQKQTPLSQRRTTPSSRPIPVSPKQIYSQSQMSRSSKRTSLSQRQMSMSPRQLPLPNRQLSPRQSPLSQRKTSLSQREIPQPQRQAQSSPKQSQRATPLSQKRTPLSQKRSPLSQRESPLSPRHRQSSHRKTPLSQRESPLSPRHRQSSHRKIPLSQRESPLSPRHTQSSHRKTPLSQRNTLSQRETQLSQRRTPLSRRRTPSLPRQTPSSQRLSSYVSSRRSPFSPMQQSPSQTSLSPRQTPSSQRQSPSVSSRQSPVSPMQQSLSQASLSPSQTPSSQRRRSLRKTSLSPNSMLETTSRSNKSVTKMSKMSMSTTARDLLVTQQDKRRMSSLSQKQTQPSPIQTLFQRQTPQSQRQMTLLPRCSSKKTPASVSKKMSGKSSPNKSVSRTPLSPRRMSLRQISLSPGQIPFSPMQTSLSPTRMSLSPRQTPLSQRQKSPRQTPLSPKQTSSRKRTSLSPNSASKKTPDSRLKKSGSKTSTRKSSVSKMSVLMTPGGTTAVSRDNRRMQGERTHEDISQVRESRTGMGKEEEEEKEREEGNTEKKTNYHKSLLNYFRQQTQDVNNSVARLAGGDAPVGDTDFDDSHVNSIRGGRHSDINANRVATGAHRLDTPDFFNAAKEKSNMWRSPRDMDNTKAKKHAIAKVTPSEPWLWEKKKPPPVSRIIVPPAAPVVQSNEAKQRRKTIAPYPRLPAALTRNIFSHFSRNSRVSTATFEEVEKVADLYWKNVVSDLAAYAKHANRATVLEADVELLLKRQRFVTDKTTMYTLVEKHMSLEHRQQIIPIALTGNVVVPKH